MIINLQKNWASSIEDYKRVRPYHFYIINTCYYKNIYFYIIIKYHEIIYYAIKNNKGLWAKKQLVQKVKIFYLYNRIICTLYGGWIVFINFHAYLNASFAYISEIV